MDWFTFTMIIGTVGLVTFGLLYLLLAERFLKTNGQGIRTPRGSDMRSSMITEEERVLSEEMMIASKEHFQLLMAAIGSMNLASWNQWRTENPNTRPRLKGVELPCVNLSFANLSDAVLSHADLSGTNLHNANLRHTDLRSTNLQKADLSGADLSYSMLSGADLRSAILRNAKLRGTDLIGASFKDADFKGADLTDVLIDPEAPKRQRKSFRGGISQLEKLALGLFSRAKDRSRPSLDADVGPSHTDKRI